MFVVINSSYFSPRWFGGIVGSGGKVGRGVVVYVGRIVAVGMRVAVCVGSGVAVKVAVGVEEGVGVLVSGIIVGTTATLSKSELLTVAVAITSSTCWVRAQLMSATSKTAVNKIQNVVLFIVPSLVSKFFTLNFLTNHLPEKRPLTPPLSPQHSFLAGSSNFRSVPSTARR